MASPRPALDRAATATAKKPASSASGGGAASAPAAKEVAGIKFASRVLEDVPPKELKPLADQLKKDVGTGVVAVVAVNEGKASLVVGVTDDLKDRYDAVALVKVGAEAIGGKGGGGRPDMAQAGGPDGAAAPKAIEAIEAALG